MARLETTTSLSVVSARGNEIILGLDISSCKTQTFSFSDTLHGQWRKNGDSESITKGRRECHPASVETLEPCSFCKPAHCVHLIVGGYGGMDLWVDG